MASDDKVVTPERDQTDEGLRIEREKTDRALAKKQDSVDETADGVIQRARDNADTVLSAARQKADDKLGEDRHDQASQVIAEQRAVEDEAIRDERSTEDDSLRQERDEDARALARLLPLERDKTDRYLLTERARSDDALSSRDDFMGIVSHDLRSLLSGIVLSASVLAKNAPAGAAGEKTRVGTKRIQQYAARMNRLVGDLVDVASIDAGRLAVAPSPGDFRAVIAEVVESFRGMAAEKGIALHAETMAAPLTAVFDHDRMIQLFANLITNSIKFTAGGGRIEISGARAGDQLCFCVSDNGAGVPGDMLEAIFERFWQAGKNDRRGLGLGLYISRNIVEAHGGRIWAKSKLGEGTQLTFTIAAAPDALRA